MRLTPSQKALLADLAQFPAEWTACEHKHEIRTARSLRKRGLVEILDELAPWFDCKITASGLAALPDNPR